MSVRKFVRENLEEAGFRVKLPGATPEGQRRKTWTITELEYNILTREATFHSKKYGTVYLYHIDEVFTLFDDKGRFPTKFEHVVISSRGFVQMAWTNPVRAKLVREKGQNEIHIYVPERK